MYGAWSFVASMLIFWVELMVARMLLPLFGGSPSVWNTALVFFQLNLLLGYAVAHYLARMPGRTHRVIQGILVLAPLLLLPVALPVSDQIQTLTPIAAVLVSLILMVGAPFLALSTSTPTLQVWFAESDHPSAGDPYFLYALSNVGSVVGLFGYPLLIEGALALRSQTLIWTIGYALFAVLTVAGASLTKRIGVRSDARGTKPALRDRVGWAAIAFIPSLALLGVTRHLSTDVAAFPLMWTIPLALYLASFVATFRRGGEKWGRVGARLVRILIVPTALLAVVPHPLWAGVVLPLALLAAASLAAHGKVYERRPTPSGLTSFYLWVSIGGAAGGLFASLVAPEVFDSVVEYPLALILAALVGGAAWFGRMRRPVVLLFVVALVAVAMVTRDAGLITLTLGVAGVAAIMWLDNRWLAVTMAMVLIATGLSAGSDLISQQRTFFGVYRIQENSEIRSLTSGTTVHGVEVLGDPTLRVAYYHPDGPVGDVFETEEGKSTSVGVIGLGVGSLALYGTHDDHFIFYEIDPLVETIARDERYFHQLSEAEAASDVVVGDGRLALEQLEPQHDLLVVDAFSSDAIPVHLLTLEAFRTYLASITEDGTIVVHISNRHFDLEPVLGRIADDLGLWAHVRHYQPDPSVPFSSPSKWVAMSRIPIPELIARGWTEVDDHASLWTDDYSNIVSIIRWD